MTTSQLLLLLLQLPLQLLSTITSSSRFVIFGDEKKRKRRKENPAQKLRVYKIPAWKYEYVEGMCQSVSQVRVFFFQGKEPASQPASCGCRAHREGACLNIEREEARERERDSLRS